MATKLLRLAPALTIAAGASAGASSTAEILTTRREWNKNWDLREGFSLKDNNGMVIPATKKLFLIRHGQYVSNDSRLTEQPSDELDFLRNDPLRPLTALGREQAALSGQRLADILVHEGLLDLVGVALKIYHSDMIRARETASIIHEKVSKAASAVNDGRAVKIPLLQDSILREGPPIIPSGYQGPWTREPYSFHEEGCRIEAAFRKFFHRPDIAKEDLENSVKKGRSKTINQVEILVGHGNVWRYCLLRAVQLQPDAWLNYGLMNGSISRVHIKDNGDVTVISLGETSHMPLSSITAA